MFDWSCFHRASPLAGALGVNGVHGNFRSLRVDKYVIQKFIRLAPSVFLYTRVHHWRTILKTNMSVPIQATHSVGLCTCHRHAIHPARVSTVRSSILPRTNSRRALHTPEALADERSVGTPQPIPIFDPLRILLSRKRSTVKTACSGTNNGAVIETITAAADESLAFQPTEESSTSASTR